MIDPIDKGRLAKDVLDNEVYQEAFQGIKQELYAQWLNSDNPQERESLHLASKLMDRLESTFKKAIANGEVELKVWEHKRTLMERVGLK